MHACFEAVELRLCAILRSYSRQDIQTVTIPLLSTVTGHYREATMQLAKCCAGLISPPVWRGALCRCEARTPPLELATYLLRMVLRQLRRGGRVLPPTLTPLHPSANRENPRVRIRHGEDEESRIRSANLSYSPHG